MTPDLEQNREVVLAAPLRETHEGQALHETREGRAATNAAPPGELGRVLDPVLVLIGAFRSSAVPARGSEGIKQIAT